MRLSRSIRMLLLAALPLVMFGAVGCGDDNDVTGSGGALASLNLDAPETVNSGAPFDMSLTATATGVENVRNGVVTITVPAPLQVTDVTEEAGTTATFSGNTVTWQLNTLDSNTSSEIVIHTMGTLPPGSPSQNLTVQATLVAEGIPSGDLVVSESVTLQQ
jgi:hypothetical protein